VAAVSKTLLIQIFKRLWIASESYLQSWNIFILLLSSKIIFNNSVV